MSGKYTPGPLEYNKFRREIEVRTDGDGLRSVAHVWMIGAKEDTDALGLKMAAAPEMAEALIAAILDADAIGKVSRNTKIKMEEALTKAGVQF